MVFSILQRVLPLVMEITAVISAANGSVLIHSRHVTVPPGHVTLGASLVGHAKTVLQVRQSHLIEH